MGFFKFLFYLSRSTFSNFFLISLLKSITWSDVLIGSSFSSSINIYFFFLLSTKSWSFNPTPLKNSTHVVYALQCGLMYIGHTKRTLGKCVSEHIYIISIRYKDHSVSHILDVNTTGTSLALYFRVLVNWISLEEDSVE